MFVSTVSALLYHSDPGQFSVNLFCFFPPIQSLAPGSRKELCVGIIPVLTWCWWLADILVRWPGDLWTSPQLIFAFSHSRFLVYREQSEGLKQRLWVSVSIGGKDLRDGIQPTSSWLWAWSGPDVARIQFPPTISHIAIWEETPLSGMLKDTET